MLLINIESLSENELRYIAKQEELEDWDSLSREELIDELEDLYEDEGDVHANHSGSSKRKFVNTLTDVQTDNVLSLPGVQKLPDSYNETSIHVVLKDFNWAYVFWSISTQQLSELEESSSSLILRTRRSDCKGSEDAVYDIDISLSDNNWTVELPLLGCTYYVSLVSRNAEGESIICESAAVATTRSYFSTHLEELRDDVTFRKIFSSLIDKGGVISANRQVQDLVDGLMTNSWNGEDLR